MGFGVPRGVGGDNTNITIKAMQAEAKSDQTIANNQQEASQEALVEQQNKGPVGLAIKAQKNNKPVKAQKDRVKKAQETSATGRMLPVDAIRKSADQFQRRNRELPADKLELLRNNIDPDDTKEQILRKVMKEFSDVSLADEALEFLLETTDGDLARKILEVKQELNQSRGREIIAGRNIHIQAREASEKGLGTPTSMRDMYRSLTKNTPDTLTLYQDLSSKYAYKDLKKVVDFLLHSLGAEMKAEATSIEPEKLKDLFKETRALQAIYGVYRFFNKRMNLVKTLFQNSNIPIPEELNFEKMTKEFMNLCMERYPSADKVLMRADRLGPNNLIQGKIITLSQFRDGVREVAVNQVYKSIQHRDDLYTAILEALEDLEDEHEKELEAQDLSFDDDGGEDTSLATGAR